MDDDVSRVLSVRTAGTVAAARSLAALDPLWGSDVQPLAGGWLVLLGAGLYINRALGAGVDGDVTPADIDFLVERSEAVGVVPSFEVTPATHHKTIEQLLARGFAHDPALDVVVLTRPVTDTPPDVPEGLAIRRVRSEADLNRWQETSAIGWGHTARTARRASDAFTVAVHAIAAEHLVLAVDLNDGRPVGCASMTLRDGVAILGGMSTIPTERRRGVQAALVRYRLRHAAGYGCDIAATTTAPGGASERNLQRQGFTPRITIRTWSLRDNDLIS